MNEANVEHLLRSMRPTAPSAELAERVREDLELAALFNDPVKAGITVKKTSSAKHRWQIPIIWSAVGAAAAALVITFLPDGTLPNSGATVIASQSAPRDAIVPMTSSREWLNVEDGGVSFATPDAPQRQMRVHSLERHQWIDPRDGAEYTVEVPKVDSVALPVKYQ